MKECNLWELVKDKAQQFGHTLSDQCQTTCDDCPMMFKEERSCNKPDHLLRSIANQPNHLKSRRVKEIMR
jgi:hypothetical protein